MITRLESFYARSAAPWATSVDIRGSQFGLEVEIRSGNNTTVHSLTRQAAKALGEALLRQADKGESSTHGDVDWDVIDGVEQPDAMPAPTDGEEEEFPACGLDGEGCP